MSEALNYEPELNLVYLPDGEVGNETNQDPAIPRISGYQR